MFALSTFKLSGVGKSEESFAVLEVLQTPGSSFQSWCLHREREMGCPNHIPTRWEYLNMIKGGNIPTMHNVSSIGKSSKENIESSDCALHMDDDKHNHWTQHFL